MAGLIGAIGAALIATVQFMFGSDAAKQGLATRAAIGLTLLLLFAWLVFFAGLRRPARLALLAAAALLPLALYFAVRIDGMTGDMRPEWSWRWNPRPSERLAKLPAPSATAAARAKIDWKRTSSDDFPQFLGPQRNGRVAGPRLARDRGAWPPPLIWRQPIGAGWSSFAVVGSYAITQEQRGDDELVVCRELESGQILWTHSDPGHFSEFLAGDGPRSTPTIADGNVYTLGAEGRLNCLGIADGSVVWTHDVLAEHRASNVQWGKSCSPAVVGDVVVVSAGGRDGHSLVAYDKHNGELIWHAGDDPSSYSSPLSTVLAGVPQILIVNHHSVVAHDPLDGHVLWRFPWEGDQPKVPQPLPIDAERVLVSAGYGVGCTMLQIKPSDTGFDWKENWSKKSLKPKFTNLVVRDGFVYGIDDGRTLVCLETADGRLRWKGGRYGHGQVLLVDDLLLIQAESGEVALVDATPERHHEWTRFQAIEGKTWNNPALAGRHLLVRNAQEAACYELPLETVPRKNSIVRTTPYNRR